MRKARGMTLIVELINHAHDTVVRAAATALRNLAVDYTNKRMIGEGEREKEREREEGRGRRGRF